jgi:hypothetical protein
MEKIPIPNQDKIYQIAIKYLYQKAVKTNLHKIYQHVPLQDPSEFTQIWTFGLRKYHLATLYKPRPTEKVVIYDLSF